MEYLLECLVMTKKIQTIFSGTVKIVLFFSLTLYAFNVYTEDNADTYEFVPTCERVCFKEKSGKARRGCSSICQAQENRCLTTGGQFKFEANTAKYQCFSAENIGIAKK